MEYSTQCNRRVVFYECETWSLTLREGCKLRVSIIDAEYDICALRDETTGEWRRLHNENLHTQYSLGWLKEEDKDGRDM
jgi:hypothetical protein